jgi:hypothetical protein
LRIAICNLIAVVALLALGCATHVSTTGFRNREPAAESVKPPTTKPILYHRTGGIAGTDDRVVIWPDGFVQVTGKLLQPAAATIPSERLSRLVALFDDWSALKNEYLASSVADDYTIAIDYDGKAIVASDLAADLPEEFRQIFTEIESIAADAAATSPRPAP